MASIAIDENPVRGDSPMRPVTGEILSEKDPSTSGKASVAAAETVDADYIILPAGLHGPEAGPAAAQPAPKAHKRPPEPESGVAGLDFLREQPAPAGILGTKATPLFWGVWSVVILAVFWISGGHALLSRGDGLGGLEVAGIRTASERLAGGDMLRFSATVTNRDRRMKPMPAMLVTVQDGDGRSVTYKLGTSRAHLEPGGSQLFSGRLAAPKVGEGRVTVRLASAGG